MVLQDINAPDGFDDAFPSDNDGYSRHSSATRFDATSLPQPIPVIGSLMGFSDYAVRAKTELTLKLAERRINRALTPEEAQALAKHLYQAEQTKSYAAAFGLGGGIYRWATTIETCRYPFYQPKPEDINPNKFMFIRGPLARQARQTWRLGLYMIVGSSLAKLVAQISAQTRAARAAGTDPELAQFAADMRKSVAADQNRAREVWAQRERGAGEHREMQERGREAANRPHAEAPPRRPWASQRPAQADDDMSPTAGNEPWSPAMDGSWGDSQARPQQGQAPSSWDRRSSQPDDDASPTGGLFQSEVQGQSNAGESAWERLRRGAQPNPQPGRREPPQRGPPGSNLGDSFTFADTEEERRRAQERAQREFDAKIERERQGKDFNDERRW